MSVIRPRPSDDPIELHVAAWGGRPWQSCQVGAAAKAVQADVKGHLEDLGRPRTLLEEYGTKRPSSRLFAILGEARRIRDAVDRLIIVSGGALACVTRLLVASCCHPFHNDLPRGERGGRPRITWLDADADIDRVEGLLDLIAPEGRPRSRDVLDQWAVLALGAPSFDELVVARTRPLAEALSQVSESDPGNVAHRLVTVAQRGSPVAAMASALGSPDRFLVEGPVAALQGVFTVAALVPAAIAGIDIVRFLEGADAMLTRFLEAPVAMNPVLVDAACRLRAARESGVVGSLFTGGGPALAELSSWATHVRPVASSPRGQAEGVSPPSLVTHVTIDEPRRRSIGFMPGVIASPEASITIRLPRLDEHALGQLLQLVILSAAVERRLEETV
jgi:glucose-6-phosphate isomerase